MPERQNNLEANTTTSQARKKLGHSAFANFRDFYNARRAEALAPDFVGPYVKTRSNRLRRSLIRSSPFEAWSGGIDPLMEDGLAAMIDDGSEYAIFTHMKTHVNTPYDLLVSSVPRGENPIIHAMDEYDERVREKIFDGVDMAITAINKVAERQDERLLRLYVVQHAALDELQEYDFSTTFPQSHFHIYGVPASEISGYDPNKTYDEFVESPGNRHVFFDPTVVLAADLYEAKFGPVEVDERTSSLILAKRDLSLKIPANEREIYVKTMAEWKSTWQKIASCFTDFSKDEYGRLVPKPKNQRINDVEELIKNNAALSEESRMILRHFATNLVNFNEDRMWDSFANNIHGSLGWTFDFENNTSTLRFAPRTFVVEHKVGATDGFYMSEPLAKDAAPVSEESRRSIIDLQKQLYAEVRRML